MDPTIIAGGLKLLGGLFGRKKKVMTPQQSIESTAAGARSAAAQYGFNALTLLAGSNATAGAGMEMGGPPPLASLSILGDFVDENFGEDAKARREHNRLQNELLTLEVDRARTLNAVAPLQSVAGGGAINGGRGNVRISGPAGGYLSEDDRNPAYADERDNTVSYQSHGQQTVVPIGPDIDELGTGLIIDAMNRGKAAKDRMSMGPMTYGAPLKAPWNGLFFNRFDEIMPPKTVVPKPKPNPKRKDLPLKSWEQKFTL